MTEVTLTQEELSVLIALLERRKEELRGNEDAAYTRGIIKQLLEKLDGDI